MKTPYMKRNALTVLGDKQCTRVYSSLLFLGANAEASLCQTARGEYRLHTNEGEISGLIFSHHGYKNYALLGCCAV
jgi:hypothetical protein